MNKLWISIIYVCFFGLIAFAIYYTNSLMPLWALILTPEVSTKKTPKHKK